MKYSGPETAFTGSHPFHSKGYLFLKPSWPSNGASSRARRGTRRDGRCCARDVQFSSVQFLRGPPTLTPPPSRLTAPLPSVNTSTEYSLEWGKRARCRGPGRSAQKRINRVAIEPWLSSCRAVEALVEAPSSRCRGRCRGLACRACRVPVEPRQAPSRLTPCAGLSRSVELSSFCRVSLSSFSVPLMINTPSAVT